MRLIKWLNKKFSSQVTAHESQYLVKQIDLDCAEIRLSGREPSFVLAKMLIERLNKLLYSVWCSDKTVPLRKIKISDITISESLKSRTICFESILQSSARVVLSNSEFGLLNVVPVVAVQKQLKAWLDFVESDNSGDFSQIHAKINHFWAVIENEGKFWNLSAFHGYDTWQFQLHFAVRNYLDALTARQELKSLLASNYSSLEYLSVLDANKNPDSIGTLGNSLEQSIEGKISYLAYQLTDLIERTANCVAILTNERFQIELRPIEMHLICHYTKALIAELGLE
ncbi:MAG: hypothetical protein SFV17_05450 [Candidatus Obscuribacter sp.]|nr:hypothetical protein [Candidatus Obscuribacter sp.]